MADVYVAPEPHICNPPQYRPFGSVWRCECGEDYFASGTNRIAEPISEWTRVGWLHWRMRRRIRMWETKVT